MIAFLLSPIGRWIGGAVLVLSIIGGVYTKGRMDGRSSYQAKVEREIKRAVERGDKARTEALKKFDQNKEIEDDEFERKDN